MDGKILKSLVSVNNVNLFKEQPSASQDMPDPMPTDSQPTSQESECIKFVNSLDTNSNVKEVFRACEKLNMEAGGQLGNLSTFTRKLPTCPVLSFISEETKKEELVDQMREAILKVFNVPEDGDFSGALLLTSCVLAKAFREGVNAVDILETLNSNPSFLSHYQNHQDLSNEERLTAAREGIEQAELETLKGNNWLNDKVLNGYAKLLAREANDATDSSVRMFIILSYTTSLWDAGMYKTYLFKRVDFSLYDLIVVPWNKNGNHWVVLVARTKDFTVSVYDSLNADNSLLIDRFCLFMSERSKIVNDGFDQWLSVQPPTNKQSDGSSCGVFVLMTLECLVNGKPSWILRQVHVPMFRRYVKDRLLAKGIRNTHLCDSLTCKDPRGEVGWVMCDVCSRWLHKACSPKTVEENEHYSCEVCDSQYS